MKPKHLLGAEDILVFGGGMGGGGKFRNRPDNLRSTDTFEMILGLGSSRMTLAPGGLQKLFVDGVPIEDGQGNNSFKDFVATLFDGDPAVLEPTTLRLGVSSGPTTVGLDLANTYTGGTPGDWVNAVVAQTGCDFVDLRFIVQQLFAQTKKGVGDQTASIEIQMRPTNSATWINPLANTDAPAYSSSGINAGNSVVYVPRNYWSVDTIATPNPQWADNAPGYLRITGKTTSAYIKEIRIAVPKTGAYANVGWNIRCRLMEPEYTVSGTNGENEDRRTIQWESVAGASSSPLGGTEAWRGLSYLNVFGKATDQINGLPEITGIYDIGRYTVPPSSVWNTETRQYTGAAWDGVTSQIAWTKCPAWQIKGLIEDDLSGVSALVPGSTLNKWDALEASKWFATQVPDGKGGTHPRYSANWYIEQGMQVHELVNYLAGAVGAFAWDEGDGRWRMKVEKPENPVMIFTKENIVGEFVYSHTDFDTRYNDIVGVFRNADNNYEEDRVRVFDQQSIDTTGRRHTSVPLIGCDNRQEALRRTMIRQLSASQETRSVTFVTNRQGRLLDQFDVIAVADGDLNSDTALRSTGRIVSLNSDRTSLTVRDTMRLEVGVSYKIRLTIPNPTYQPEPTAQPSGEDWRHPTITITRNVTNTSPQRGDITTLYIDAPLPSNLPSFAPVSLEAVGLPALPKQYRVLGIEPQDDGERVAIIAHEIYTAKWVESDAVTEEALAAQLSNRIVPSPTAPSDGMFHVRSFATDFIDKRVLTISWDRAPTLFLRDYRVEYRFNGGPWTSFNRTTERYVELPDPVEGRYEFRIYARDRRDRESAPLVATLDLDEFTPVIPADKVVYADLSPLEAWKPAQPGADVTGDNTSNDTNHVGGRPVADILAAIDAFEAEGPADIVPPSTPTGFDLTSQLHTDTDGSQYVKLIATWNAVTADDLGSYTVALKEGAGPYIEFIVGPNTTRFERIVQANTLFTGKVRASDKANNPSVYSAEDSVTTLKDTTPPGPPTPVSVTAAFQSIFIVYGTPADTDLDKVELAFSNSSSFGGAGLFATVNATPSQQNSFTHSVNGSGVSKWYWGRTVDKSGNVSSWTYLGTGTTIRAVEADIADAAVSAAKLNVKVGGGNLLRNSSFDNGTHTSYAYTTPAGYSIYDNARVGGSNSSTDNPDGTAWGISSGGGRRGGNYLAITWTNLTNTKGLYLNNTGGANNAYLFKANQYYTWSFYACAANSGVGRTMGTAWNNSPNELTWLENPALNGQWQRYVVRFKWTTNTVDNNGFLSIFPYTGGGGAGTLLFDDMQIEEGEYPTSYSPAFLPGEVTSPMIAPGAVDYPALAAEAVHANNIAALNINGGHIASDTMQTRHFQAQSVTATKMFIGDTSNMVLDSDLVDLAAWTTNAVVGLTPVNSTMASKNYVAITGSGYRYFRTHYLYAAPVEVGKPYFISTFLFCAPGGTTPINAYAVFFDEAGGGVSTPFIGATSAAAWTRVSATIVAPAGAKTMGVWVEAPVGSGSNDVYMGEPTIRPATTSELIVDGAIIGRTIKADEIEGYHVKVGTLHGDRIQAGTFTGDRFNTGTSLPGTITVGSTGVSIATVQNQAANTVPVSLYDPISGRYTIAGNSVTRASQYGWDTNVYSREVYTGSAQVSGQLTTVDTFLGLMTTAHRATGNNYGDFDMSVHRSGNGNWYVYTYGGGSPLNMGSAYNGVTFSPNTMWQVTYDGTAWRVLADGVQMYSQAAASGLSVVAAVAIYSIGSKVSAIGFGPFNDNSLSLTDPAARINANSTRIEPGLITIQGGTTLDSWRDQTEIRGGAVKANSLDASKLRIGSRGIQTLGLEFEWNPSTNVISWTDGYVSYIGDNGVGTSTYVNAGSASMSGYGYMVFNWVKGASTISWSQTLHAGGEDVIQLASWWGGARLNANYGGTIIHGDRVSLGTLNANRVVAGSITALQLATSQLITVSAQIGDGVITNAKIGNLEVDSAKIANLTVGTEKITGNAVSNTASSYTAGSVAITTTAGSWTTLQSIAISTAGYPVKVDFFSLWARSPSSPGTTYISVRLVRSGTVLGSDFTIQGITSTNNPAGFAYLDQPGAGTYTYEVQAWTPSLGGSVSINAFQRSLFTMELKR